MKTITLCGHKYKVSEGAIDGLCDTHKKEMELINLTPPGTRNHLETWIHEALHGCDWNKNEAMVMQTGHDIARLLWALGYRREK